MGLGVTIGLLTLRNIAVVTGQGTQNVFHLYTEK